MKRNKYLFVALSLSVLYLVYIGTLVFRFSIHNGNIHGVSIYHIILFVCALVFNALAFGFLKKYLILITGILYCASMIFSVSSCIFVFIQMILCFIAYGEYQESNM